jgi:hypothetical protein
MSEYEEQAWERSKRAHSQLVAERDRLRARVDELEAGREREARDAFNRGMRAASAERAALADSVDEHAACIAELRQALRTYGDHGYLCGSHDGEPCTCGLDAALAKEVP